jgi:hypothetical protein
VGDAPLKLQVTDVELGGTGRRVALQPGLNVISGPITTGKSTALRLTEILVGGSVSQLPPEVRERVPAIVGGMVIGASTYRVYRPLVSTATARVEVAGAGKAWRLPATSPMHGSDQTYSNWLLERLGLPRLEVPSAPTRPDSRPTPVSMADYLNYCILSDSDIDSSVYGHTHPYRDIKRKYVFQILYGIYGIEAAALQEQYRELSAAHGRLSRARQAIDSLLDDTPWANRAQLANEIKEAAARLEEVTSVERAAFADAALTPLAHQLRSQVQSLDVSIADVSSSVTREDAAADNLRRLARQLETQSDRLTRAIVAETHLLDFEFTVCPRCGATIGDDRGDDEICRLCLQPPTRTDDRSDLVEEQNRLGLQLAETRDLIHGHEQTAESLRRKLTGLLAERRLAGDQLDQQTESFVSDSASRIATRTAERVRAEERLMRLRDYASLFLRLEEAETEEARLASRLEEIEAQLEDQGIRGKEANERIDVLDRNFEAVLDAFHIPRFADPPFARIDRRSFLPVVDGRDFATASQGMKVLINVAHALAHQLTSLEVGTALPNLLIIDALSSNIGHGGYDEAIRERVYEFLAVKSDEVGDRLQVIVADNDVPHIAASFVRLQLSHQDLLVPNERGLSGIG